MCLASVGIKRAFFLCHMVISYVLILNIQEIHYHLAKLYGPLTIYYFPERDQRGPAIWYPNAEIVRLYTKTIGKWMAVALPSESCQLEYRIRNRFSILHYTRIKKVKAQGELGP